MNIFNCPGYVESIYRLCNSTREIPKAKKE